MDDHPPKIKILVFFILVAELPTRAEACGMCMAALYDRFLPPVLFWCLFAIAWFLLVSIWVTLAGERVGGIPSLGPAVLLVLVLSFLGLGMIGPFGILLLLLPFPIVAWKAFVDNNEKFDSPSMVKALQSITVISLILLFGLLGYSIHLRKSRSDSEFILRWENAYPAKSLLSELVNKGQQSLPDLRIIVQKGGYSNAAAAAQALADFGTPETDIPLLKQKTEVCESDSACDPYRKALDKALHKLLEKENNQHSRMLHHGGHRSKAIL